MNIPMSKETTASFTGHRHYDFSNRETIRSRLSSAILEAYGLGYRNFISGFAVGIDMLAAEVVVSLKDSHPDIRLIAAIPFDGQAARFSVFDKRRYDRLMAKADDVIVLSEHYFTRCFLERDEFMVNNSSRLIAYYDGREKGGTYYTVKKAREQNIHIVNVY